MYIYVISTKNNCLPVKIGKANNPVNKLKTLQTGSFMELEIKHIIKCKSEKHSFSLEKEIHIGLSSFRGNGEWFNYKCLTIFRRFCNRRFSLHGKIFNSKLACWDAVNINILIYLILTT